MQYRGWLVAATLALGCVPVLAEDVAPGIKKAEKKSEKKAERKMRAPVDSQALDRRVGDAKTIFVGEAVRIYFVDRRNCAKQLAHSPQLHGSRPA